MRHGLTLHKPTSALSARESIRRTNKRRILCLGGINAVAMRGPVQDTDTLSTPNQKSSQGAEGRPPPLPLLSLQARPTVSHRRMASGRLLVGVAQWPGTNSSFRRELRNPEKIGEAQDIPVGSSGSPPGQALLQQIYVVSVSTTSCQHLDLIRTFYVFEVGLAIMSVRPSASPQRLEALQCSPSRQSQRRSRLEAVVDSDSQVQKLISEKQSSSASSSCHSMLTAISSKSTRLVTRCCRSMQRVWIW